MSDSTYSGVKRAEKMGRKKKHLLLQCPNPKCRYSWTYNGKFFLYATCPSCRRSVKILENKISSSLQPVQVERPVQAAITASAISITRGENNRRE